VTLYVDERGLFPKDPGIDPASETDFPLMSPRAYLKFFPVSRILQFPCDVCPLLPFFHAFREVGVLVPSRLPFKDASTPLGCSGLSR